MRGVRTVTVVLLAAFWFTCAVSGQTQASSEQVLSAGRTALQQRHYAEAIQILEGGLKSYPDNRNLKIEHGPRYTHNHQNNGPLQPFREFLLEDPSTQRAKT